MSIIADINDAEVLKIFRRIATDVGHRAGVEVTMRQNGERCSLSVQNCNDEDRALSGVAADHDLLDGVKPVQGTLRLGPVDCAIIEAA